MSPSQRLEAARTEIARRRVHATAQQPRHWEIEAGCTMGEVTVVDGIVGHAGLQPSEVTAAFIADNDPAYVLAVLKMHDELLHHCDEWMLSRLGRGHSAIVPDAMRALLDIYAPVSVDA